MFGQHRPAPPRCPMCSVDLRDAVLVEECGEFSDLLASYVAGCADLEEAEASAAETKAVEEVEHRLATTRRQWRAALLRLGAMPAHTGEGALAKVDAIQAYLAEHPVEDLEAMLLMRSVFADMKRLLGTG